MLLEETKPGGRFLQDDFCDVDSGLSVLALVQIMISTSKRCSYEAPRAESLALGTPLKHCMLGFSLSLLDFPRKLTEDPDIFGTSTRTVLFWQPC